MSAPCIAFLWNTPHKPSEQCIRRQVLGSSRFEPVVLNAASNPVLPHDFPAPVLPVPLRRNLWRKLYLKYVQRVPRDVYNRPDDGLRVITRQLDARLLHVFFGTKALKYLPFLKRLDIPISVSFHGFDVSECAAPASAPRLREMLDLVGCVMVRSHFMAAAVERMGCPPDKLWINRAGVPLADFPYRERTRPATAPFTFLQSGRLVPKKGLDLTIAAFGRIRPHLPGARLWIAGEGEIRGDLERQIRQSGLGEAVELCGFLEQPALLERLHAADLFVHPSRTAVSGDQEGIPNALLEAMATGLPAVSTRHAGIPEAVHDGENGWLVAEGSVDELAAALLRCARDPAALAAAGRAARAFIEREHSLAERMRLLDDKYAELIEARQLESVS